MAFFRVRRIEILGARYVAPGDILARLHVDTLASVWDPTEPLVARVADPSGNPDVRSSAASFPERSSSRSPERVPVALVPAAGGFRVYDAARRRAADRSGAHVAVDAPVLDAAPTPVCFGCSERCAAECPDFYARVSAITPRRGQTSWCSQLNRCRLRAMQDVTLERLADIDPVEAISRAGSCVSPRSIFVTVTKSSPDSHDRLLRSLSFPRPLNPERLVAGLDIGSAKTTAIIAEVVGDLPQASRRSRSSASARRARPACAAASCPTSRRRRARIQQGDAGRRADGRRAGGERLRGHRRRARAGDDQQGHRRGDRRRDLAKSDVERANDVARAQAIPQDRELLHAIPQEYTVDKNVGIRDPIGMSGTRLETEMYLVTIGSSPAINLRKSVERAGYKVRELVLEPLASALARAHRGREGAGRRAGRDGRRHHRPRGLPRGEDPPPRHDRVTAATT